MSHQVFPSGGGPPLYSKPRQASSKPKERRGLSNSELVELGLHLSDEDILRDENWICWKSRILNLLDIADLRGYPLGQIPQPDKDREPDEYEIWDERDQEAFYILFRNISHQQLLHTPASYTQDMTSAELWNSLRQINENHSWMAVGLKMRKLYSARAGEGSDIEKHLFDLQKLRLELADANHHIKDDLFNCIVVTSLPPSWDDYTAHIRGLLSFQGETGISTPRLVSMLEYEYQHRLKPSSTKKRKREGEACGICRKDNHIADECRWKSAGYCTHCERGGHWTRKCWSKRSTTMELDAGDIVVRRKRKRHLISSAYNCCLLCKNPEATLTTDAQFSATDTTEVQASPEPASDVLQDLESQVYAASGPLPAILDETTVTSNSDHVENLVTVDTFLKRRVQRPRKYKARFNKLTNVEEDEDEVECLHLRTRRIQRTIASSPAPGTSDSNADEALHSVHKDRHRKFRRPKRNRLAEKLLTAVMMTSGEPNEELLQSGADDENPRIPLSMVAVPRPSTISKPRKWCLVDPRKVATPFRASVFRTTGEGRALAETPMSYERFAHQRFEVVRETNNDGVVECWRGEPSSPCERRRAAKRSESDAISTIYQPPLSKKRTKKPRGKSNTNAQTLSSSQRAPAASDCGRKPLDMVPVLIKSRTSD